MSIEARETAAPERLAIFKRNIVLTLLEDAALAFRMVCFGRGITTSEFLDECVARLIEGDQSMLRVCDDIAKGKREDRVQKMLRKIDSRSIYDAIEGG